ncbi:MAG: FAD:protein FMN transferase [Nitrospirota bacterium]|nr:FAD:protein FMN transferase [Nitrospirota bacterium]
MRSFICLSVCLALAVVTGCLYRPVASAPTMVKRSQMLMGTLVFVTAVAGDVPTAQQAAADALKEVRRLEELLSTWIPTSELSHLNDAAGREPVKVSRDTMQVLTRSLQVAQLTEGGFNIAVGPAVQAWSVTEQSNIPSQEQLDRLFPLVDLSALLLDDAMGTAYLMLAGMRVDVGGIGKGFAADRAVEAMRAAGATGGVVALSGDIKTFGRMPDGETFLFGIQHPRKETTLLATIELHDEAISTAGDYERFFERDGVRYHHILDPRTLQPARECQSVTVIAKEGVMADGLDTGIFVMGPKRGMELVERLPDVEAVIVDRDGAILVSSGLKARVQFTDSTNK